MTIKTQKLEPALTSSSLNLDNLYSSPILTRLPRTSMQSDGSWLAKCPSHSDNNPSLVMSRGDNDRLLLNCRAGCSTEDILAAINCSWDDLFDIKFPDEFAVAPNRLPAGALSQKVVLGLTTKTAVLAENFDLLDFVSEKYGLTEGQAFDLRLGHKDPDRLSVPFLNPEGQAVCAQYRALSENAATRWTTEPNPSTLEAWSRVGMFKGDNQNFIILTEGPSDALTVVGAGFTAIAVRGAAQVDEATADTIVSWADGRRILLAADGDPAGQLMNMSIAQMLRQRGVHPDLISLPEGHDIQSVFATQGAAAVRELIASATPMITIDARDPDRFPDTDIGNADLAIEVCASTRRMIRFVPEVGWFFYTNGAWEKDSLLIHRNIVRDVEKATKALVDNLMLEVSELNEKTSELHAEAESLANSGDDDAADSKTQAARKTAREAKARRVVAKRWLAHSKYCGSSAGISNMLREFGSDPRIATDVSMLDTHPDLLLCMNGVIDLRTAELLPFDPDLLLTQRVPFDFDPVAEAPLWREFLDQVMQCDSSMTEYLQHLTGYGLTGHTSEQSFVLHHGMGANGKSVYIDTLAYTFSGIAERTPMATFMAKSSGSIPNDIAALRGARLVFASEGDVGQKMGEALLKQVTGDTEISARFLQKEFFTFRPTFLIQLMTNHRPEFNSVDLGLWRRIKLVSWGRTFSKDEQDPKLLDKLRLEAEGILNWAVQGAVVWYKNGLNEPDPIKLATQEYKSSSDPLAGFLPNVYILDDGKQTLGKDIKRDYDDWAMDEGIKPIPRTSLFKMFEDRGVIKESQHQGVLLTGIRRARPSDFGEKDPQEFTLKTNGKSTMEVFK